MNADKTVMELLKLWVAATAAYREEQLARMREILETPPPGLDTKKFREIVDLLEDYHDELA